MSNPKIHHHNSQRTSPFWWFVAVVCSILAVAVIIAGIVLFVGYLVIHPRFPILSVVNANLDHFDYDPTGNLVTQVTVVIRSENDNTKAHASFSGMSLTLLFDGIAIAYLRAGPYEVKKNSTLDFNYVATSDSIPLSPDQMGDVDVFLNKDDIRFELKGKAKSTWRVGVLGLVKFECNLNCQLRFHINGSYVPGRCTSKAK